MGRALIPTQKIGKVGHVVRHIGLVVEWLTRCSHTAETPGSIPGEPINIFAAAKMADAFCMSKMPTCEDCRFDRHFAEAKWGDR